VRLLDWVNLLLQPIQFNTLEAADIRLFASVGAKMSAQIKVQGKPLTTHITLERLVTRVHQHVALQLRIVKELFVATLNWA
jgi:hypothetical protein